METRGLIRRIAKADFADVLGVAVGALPFDGFTFAPKVQVTGTNWDPANSSVSLAFTNGPDLGSATVDSAGNLTGTITVGDDEFIQR